MNSTDPILSRRGLLRGSLALGAMALFTPGVFAEQLARTPRLTEGPFYPDKLPLDTDNDLVIVNNSITPAVGEITHLTGRVLSISGEPIKDAVVEIWQVDNKGVYLHTADSGPPAARHQLPGFRPVPPPAPRASTDSGPSSRFLTPAATPHIHVKVKKGERELLTTQIFVNGHPQNNRDMVFGGIRDLIDRELVLVDFKPLKESKVGELSARFDIVVGLTPADADDARPPRGRR